MPCFSPHHVEAGDLIASFENYEDIIVVEIKGSKSNFSETKTAKIIIIYVLVASFNLLNTYFSGFYAIISSLATLSYLA